MPFTFLQEKINCSDWEKLFQREASQDYFKQLEIALHKDFETNFVHPCKRNIFKAFELTPLSKVKVVLLGQDPYHGKGQANGLCFSVNKGVHIPPSLRNIFKEMNNDLKFDGTLDGDLSHWAKQGVLLLNETLTVIEARPTAHQNIGWSRLTDAVISTISREKKNIVFVFWGKHAGKKKVLVNQEKHLIIESPHPSPLSAHRGFFGSKPFSKINCYLEQTNQKTINWSKG